jgi:hypothetical protein
MINRIYFSKKAAGKKVQGAATLQGRVFISVLANRLSLEGISINKEWENWLRTPFSAHHKPKYIGPVSANAGVSCTME